MPLLHDQAVRSRIESRLRALTPDRRPLWGKMSVDQMLWHLNEALAGALGEIDVAPPEKKPPIPGWLMKFLVINVPWGKGAPTMPAFVAKGSTISKPSGPGASACCKRSWTSRSKASGPAIPCSVP